MTRNRAKKAIFLNGRHKKIRLKPFTSLHRAKKLVVNHHKTTLKMVIKLKTPRLLLCK